MNKRIIVLFVSILAVAALLSSQPAPREQVGPLPDGGYLLNSGWRVDPAGTQIPLDTLPMSCVLTKDGRYLLVLNGGYRPPSISVIETASMHEVSRTSVPDGWLGLALSPDNKTLWVGGGSKASIFEFTLSDDGKLTPARTFEIIPAAGRTYRDFIGDVAVSPDGHLLYAADLYHDSIAVINPQSGRVIDHFKTGRRPYRILFAPDGKTFFVTSWADGTLYQHQTTDGQRVNSVRLGAHPTDMVWSDVKPATEDGSPSPLTARLFVTAANTNSVYVIGVTGNDLRVMETINVGMTPRHPLGMTPSALALSQDQKRLYVVCSDANAVAVVNVGETQSDVRGFIPVGWYPTAARVLDDGRLVVLNGKGSRSYPNPNGPSPMKKKTSVDKGGPNAQYVANMQTGTASVIAPFNPEQLASYTQRALDDSPYRDEMMNGYERPAGNPIPERPGDPSLIEHVIYIIKENRTYDQVLGDIGKGASDPSLVLFGERITPNAHKMARQFVLFDNFYVNADVSAGGWNWSTAAIAPDYVEKMWPNSYAGRRKHYDYEGGEAAALPPAGYLWTNAIAKGVSLRNYGYWVTNKKAPVAEGENQVNQVRDPALAPFTNLQYRGFDLNYPDVERAKVFLKDFNQFETTDQMPKLILLRLGNDHTFGSAPGKLSPLALAADNDYAVGMVVDAVSRSKFWKSTAIFILEDDAQNGPDHIDSHRSPALVLSPYTRRGVVDSTMYNTTSVLRTMELILGLRPMTHYDAGATPMYSAFANQPDLAPYDVEKPRVSLTEHNTENGVAADESRHMDFEDADLNDDDELNDVLWRAIRKTAPPPPSRSFNSRTAGE